MSDLKITMAAARVNAGLTQQKLAELMHVSKATVTHWETNKKKPSFAQLHLFCSVVGMPEDAIFLP